MVCECKCDDGLLDSSESDISCIDFVSKLKKQPSIFKSLMIRSNLVECLRTFGLDINQNDEVVSYVLGYSHESTYLDSRRLFGTLAHLSSTFYTAKNPMRIIVIAVTGGLPQRVSY